jgi:hypothetical protein
MAKQDLSKGTYSKYGEVLPWWTYYDTQLLAAATTQFSMFQLAEGQGSPAKTKAQTNMSANGEIPTGQHFTVKAIKFMFKSAAAIDNTVLNDFYNMLANTSVEVKIPGKDNQLCILAQELLGAATLLPFLPAATFNGSPIQPRFHGIFPLGGKGLVLAENTQFSVKVTHHSAVAAAMANDIFKIGLAGTLKRRS